MSSTELERRLEEAQATLDEAFAVVEKRAERYWEAELHRQNLTKS